MDTNQKMVKAGMMKMVKTASRNVYTIAVCHNYERYMSPDGRLGSKIQAVKLVRQVTGVGLKEAKDFVEGTRALRLTFSQIDHLTDSSFVIAESTDPFASTEMPCYLTTPTLAQPEKTSLVRIAVVINGKRAFAYADNKTATMTDDEHEKYAKAAAIQANRWEGAPLRVKFSYVDTRN